MKILYSIVAVVLCAMAVSASDWQPDVLGDGYEMRYVDQGQDYAGNVRSTIIRKKSACGSHEGILYVHGYNDYFFQKEMGDRMVDSCLHFYAVDLRRYGRSLMPGQTPYQVRDMREYFADIDSAIVRMKMDGVRHIVLMGHSTGGLTASLYMAEHANDAVAGLILNSPFLDWNLGGLERFVPFISGIGALLPNIKINQGESSAYAESLLARYGGEWDYNTAWKTVKPRPVDTGWVRAIDQAQARLQHGADIAVPVLLMRSTRSAANPSGSDIVLDVDDIGKYGKLLGHNVTSVRIDGGLHDLVLSQKPVRDAVYDYIFHWLHEIGLR